MWPLHHQRHIYSLVLILHILTTFKLQLSFIKRNLVLIMTIHFNNFILFHDRRVHLRHSPCFLSFSLHWVVSLFNECLHTVFVFNLDLLYFGEVVYCLAETSEFGFVCTKVGHAKTHLDTNRKVFEIIEINYLLKFSWFKYSFLSVKGPILISQ